MDCRTFHRNLEDYLEGGLDFTGRFGMERHAQQCLRCGKELADAQQLRRVVSGLQRVKAPVNFESSLLREIATHKGHGRFWSLRTFWIYGFETPSWRKMAFASSGLLVLSLGIFYALHRPGIETVANAPVLSPVSPEAVVQVKEVQSSPNPEAGAILPKTAPAEETARLAQKAQPVVPQAEPEEVAAQESPEMDYVEYLLPGPDNYTVPVRLPKKIPMRYSQMSEEYFIRNVSH